MITHRHTTFLCRSQVGRNGWCSGCTHLGHGTSLSWSSRLTQTVLVVLQYVRRRPHQSPAFADVVHEDLVVAIHPHHDNNLRHPFAWSASLNSRHANREALEQMKKFQVDHLLHKQIRRTTRSDCLDWPRFDLRRRSQLEKPKTPEQRRSSTPPRYIYAGITAVKLDIKTSQ